MKKYFYVIENALLNLGKNKGRNFLQGAVIFAVITTTVVALSIHDTSAALISEYKAYFGNEASISPELMPSYAQMVTPLEGLRDISFTFLLIALALGAAIAVLLSVIAVRERKYEIGVLRAMGMKKRKVAMGLGVEIIAITCVCYLFGMIAGFLLSQPISDVLLAGRQSAGLVNAAAAQSLTSVKISVSPLTALEIFGVAILLASIAGMISVRQVTKYEPIRILTERN
jgi:ABC-type antimicrobial peptide transport system permease subunit